MADSSLSCHRLAAWLVVLEIVEACNSSGRMHPIYVSVQIMTLWEMCPQDIVEEGLISDAQLEAVVYANMRFQSTLSGRKHSHVCQNKDASADWVDPRGLCASIVRQRGNFLLCVCHLQPWEDNVTSKECATTSGEPEARHVIELWGCMCS